MNKPLFNINNNIINMVAKINKKLGYLEANIDKKKELHLRKTSKIKSVGSSCAIENNSLSLDEVEGVINGKRVIAPTNEITEIQNAYECYNNIHIYKPYKIESFLDAHKTLTSNLIKESGKFRDGDVGVYDNGNLVHIGARPEFVSNLIKDLFEWGLTSDTNDIIKACVIHYEIETIHPFSDGNGRIGRLWQSLILYNYNKLFEYIPIETLVYEHQEKYYKAIEDSRKMNSGEIFIEFMLDVILRTIEEFDLNVLEKTDINLFNNLSKTEKDILNKITPLLKNGAFVSITEMIHITGKNSANLRKYLRKFEELNIIEVIGEKKARKYKMKD